MRILQSDHRSCVLILPPDIAVLVPFLSKTTCANMHGFCRWLVGCFDFWWFCGYCRLSLLLCGCAGRTRANLGFVNIGGKVQSPSKLVAVKRWMLPVPCVSSVSGVSGAIRFRQLTRCLQGLIAFVDVPSVAVRKLPFCFKTHCNAKHI